MKIIIAGAGAVGTHLAQLLAKENQDITLVDESEEKLSQVADHVDLMTLNVKPTSIHGLKDAGAAHADLFIAVTPDEMKNITCCMLAHTLGAKKTVARIDNAEYLNAEYKDFFRNMGINSLIFPEILAAKDIIEGIKHSWVRQWWEVHNGALVMLGIKLRETAEILNIPLKTLCGPDTSYHIVAIKRCDTTIIPNGETSLQLGDIAYFMTTKKYIPYIRKIVGKEHYEDVKNVMIMGGGRTAMHTALNVPGYMEVKIIESDPQRCDELNEVLGDKAVMVIHGDARDSSLLMTEQADGGAQDSRLGGQPRLHLHGRKAGHRHHHQQKDHRGKPHLPNDAGRRRQQREMPYRGRCRRGRVRSQARRTGNQKIGERPRVARPEWPLAAWCAKVKACTSMA